jgi:arabinose-5-phosphate isomerase
MSKTNIIKTGKGVIKTEAEAVVALVDRINDQFEKAVSAIISCKGRLVVLGVGKSGLIAQKIAATMASTGTPSQFVHPGDAFHGDLGMITKNDIVLIISNSGETHELIQIVPAIRNKKVHIVGMIGREKSTLYNSVDIIIDTSVEKEACLLNLAPTSSTTATLAMGDALSISILEHRGFSAQDFAELHPGGSLGKKLLLTIDQFVHKNNAIPFVKNNTTVKNALLVISDKGLGVTGVLDSNDKLIGIITDGDIRRGLEKSGNTIFENNADFLMSKNPISITNETLAITALEIMEKHNITSLFVYSNSDLKKPDGIVHIHDLLKTGIR